MNDSDSKVIYIKTHYSNYSQIPLINCNNQTLKYARSSMINSTYILNNIDVILPVYFTKDSTYGYCLKIVGDPVINQSRTSVNSSTRTVTTLYSSGYFEHMYSYAPTKKKEKLLLSHALL